MKIKIFGVLCLIMLVFVLFSGCQENNGGNIPEIGDIEFSPLNPVIYESVAFSIANAESLSGQGLTFTWDFGDNSTDDSDTSVAYRYPEEGNYTVKLVVSDGDSFVEKYVDVQVDDSSIYSFDVDLVVQGAWNAKVRIINSSSLEYRVEISDQSGDYIFIYNNSEDVFYDTKIDMGDWISRPKGTSTYVTYYRLYTDMINVIAYELKGVKIGDNFLMDYFEDTLEVHINDVNCVFSNDLFMPPADEEIY